MRTYKIIHGNGSVTEEYFTDYNYARLMKLDDAWCDGRPLEFTSCEAVEAINQWNKQREEGSITHFRYALGDR